MKLKTLFIILILIGCIGQISSDIYAPALPQVAHFFSIPMTLAQMSLTIYLFFMAISQLIYGPLSEAIGRKKPLMVGICIYTLGSLICMISQNIDMLIVGRVIQGCGAGSSAALWRSIFRDCFTGDDLSKYGSYFGIALTFVIPAAPAIGGYLNQYLGFHSIFIFLFVYAVAALLMLTINFEETHSNPDKNKLKRSIIAAHFKEILTHKVFIGASLASFFTYGAFFSWFTVGPALMIHHLGLSSSTFGWLCLITAAIAMSIASFVNARLVKKFGGDTMLATGWGIMILSGIGLLTFQTLIGSNIIAITAMVTIMYFGATLIWPNLFAKAFTPFGHMAGYAGALYSCFQLGGGAILASLLAHLPNQNSYALAACFIITPIIAGLARSLTRKTAEPT